MKNYFKKMDESVKFDQSTNKYYVTISFEMAKSIVSSYIKKVKEQSDVDLSEELGNTNVAEKLINYVISNIDVETLPINAIYPAVSKYGDSTDVAPQGDAQNVVVDDVAPQGEAQTQGQVQGQVQGQAQTQGQVQTQDAQDFVQVQPQGQVQAQTQGQAQPQTGGENLPLE